MDAYFIPLTNHKHILYRPRLGVACVGNAALVGVARAVLADESISPASSTAAEFLQHLGFFEADPPTPAEPVADFRPTTAVLLLTNQCQLRCTYCYAAAGELSPRTLTPELGRAAIDYVCRTAQALGRAVFEVSFHGGGEPTLAWQTLQACTQYARQQALPAQLTLTSNGLWSRAQCAWIIEHLDGLSLSLDGGPETQDRQRPSVSGRGSSALVMRTVAQLDAQHFPYGMRLTATAPWTHLPEDVRFLCEHTGCQSMQVEPAFNTTRGGHSAPEVAEALRFAEAFTRALEIATQAGRRLFYSGARLGTVTPMFCQAPFNALIVNAEGELVSCYEVSGPTHPLAALSVIGHIEHGEVRVDEVARARLHGLMAERRAACRECFCFWSCAGDCYTRAFTPDDHLRFGARCELNQHLTRAALLNRLAEGGGVWRVSHAIAA